MVFYFKSLSDPKPLSVVLHGLCKQNEGSSSPFCLSAHLICQSVARTLGLKVSRGAIALGRSICLASYLAEFSSRDNSLLPVYLNENLVSTSVIILDCMIDSSKVRNQTTESKPN